MRRFSKPHALSDGTTIRIRTRRTIAGTYYDEVPSRKRTGISFMRLAGSMFLLVHGTTLFRITHPAYSSASTDAEGADAALRFCVDSAEAIIAQAHAEGIDIDDCYHAPDNKAAR